VQGVNDLAPLLADVNIAPDSTASIAGLGRPRPRRRQRPTPLPTPMPSATSHDDACIPGDAVVASATALSVEIAGWDAP
jgi:hypothetical protein